MNTSNPSPTIIWSDPLLSALRSFFIPVRPIEHSPKTAANMTNVPVALESATRTDLSATMTLVYALLTYVVHILTGVSIFLLLLIPSIAINFLTVWLANQEVSALIITSLKVCNYINTIVDALLFIIFIMRVTFQSITEL